MHAIPRHQEGGRIPAREARSTRVSPHVPDESSVAVSALVRATRAELLAERQAAVIAILAELLDQADLERALDALVGALQERFRASRVAMALVSEKGPLALAAISQQALVDLATDEARLLTEVMEECLDHERLVSFPEPNTGLGVLVAHRSLGSRRAQTTMTSVPLFDNAEPVGVLLIERHEAEPFTESTLKLLELMALMAAPFIALRREAERSAFSRLRLTSRKTLQRYFGAGRYGARLLLVFALASMTIILSVPLPQSVAAQAELVPRERRLITAPFDGFVEEVMVEPGETVVAGQLLARLERRELELELTRRDGEIASAESEFRAAMASHDRQATAIARARLERERALRALVNQRLERIELRAPIAGLIVSGDPSDAVGTPVTRGKVLFEIARADGYEVHLMVHERDIRKVRDGQIGTLALRARPREAIPLTVHAIHPVAESANGASRFRVRATLAVPPGLTPRPGESGVANLDVETASLVKQWGRPLVQRLTELWWRFSL